MMNRFCLLLLVFISPWSQAAFTASVDKDQVRLGESLTLILSSDNTARNLSPDLTPLKKEFRVLGQTSSQRYQLMNGQSSQSHEWHITVSPKQKGTLTIPKLTLGQEQTEAITITVSNTGSTRNPGQQGLADILTEVTAQPGIPYQQEQVIYTVKILLGPTARVDNLQVTEPNVPEGTLLKLDKDLQYKTTRRGKSYHVIERRYALFPQQAGPLKIEGATLAGQKIVQSKGSQHDPYSVFHDPFFSSNLFKQSEPFVLPIDPITIEVLPIASAYPQNSAWLPAEQVTLEESWSDIPAQGIRAGEPITRTLTLTAKGLTGPQLPPLPEVAIAGSKQYTNPPEIDSISSVSGITGTRIENRAYVPTQAGTLHLPAIELNWWNKSAHQLATVTLPARHITVLPALANPNLTPNANALVKPSQPATEQEAHADHTAAKLLPLWWLITPWILVLVFAGLWLVTWQRLRRMTKPPAASANTQQTVLVTPKISMAKLQQACSNQNVADTVHLLIRYGQQQFPDAQVRSLYQLIQLFQHDALLVEALAQLDKALYEDPKMKWPPGVIWDTLQRITHTKPPSQSSTESAWEPLHPID